MDERKYERRIVTIPAELRADVNKKLDAMGWGPDSFSIAIVAKTDKDAVVKAYCCHVAINEQRRKQLLAAGVKEDAIVDPGKERGALSRELDKSGDRVKAVAVAVEREL